jgi:predicted nucleotidyltransferase
VEASAPSSRRKMHKLIMATLAGSHLYGTNRPDSDIDIRGVCFSPKEALLGLSGFEQYQPKTTAAVAYSKEQFDVESDDVTIYALNKFFMLCLNANPNIVELLFAPVCKMLYVSPLWAQIEGYRDIFLSTKIVHTFAGYAFSQLKRIERHKAWLDNPPVEPDPYDYTLYSNEHGAQKWRDNDQANIYRELHKRWKEYQTWRKNRNPARAKLEERFGYDTKHAAHLYRLSLEAKELLITGALVLPLQQGTRETYKAILNGVASYDTVVAKAHGIKDELLELEKSSVLPKRPNHKAAEELLIKLQWYHLHNVN